MTAPDIQPVADPDFGVLRVAGRDARGFLQGQLSCDVKRLSPSRALLGSLNSASGRVQAVLTLFEAEAGIGMLLPSAMQERVLARLRSHVLRSDVALVLDASCGAIEVGGEAVRTLCAEPPLSAGECRPAGQGLLLRWWSTEERFLWLGPAAPGEVGPSLARGRRDAWKRAEIAAGVPQVFPETCELFVAPMLNLEDLGGISFEKGCYAGQEVIARAHYRGTVTRRMHRFAARCAPPAPGTAILLSEKSAGHVVDSAPCGDSCELLGVVEPAQVSADLRLAGCGAPLEPLAFCGPASGRDPQALRPALGSSVRATARVQPGSAESAT